MYPLRTKTKQHQKSITKANLCKRIFKSKIGLGRIIGTQKNANADKYKRTFNAV